MMLGLRKKKKESDELKEARKSLAEMDALAAREEIVRRNLSARLTALQVELDNLTRRGGNVASQ